MNSQSSLIICWSVCKTGHLSVGFLAIIRPFYLELGYNWWIVVTWIQSFIMWQALRAAPTQISLLIYVKYWKMYMQHWILYCKKSQFWFTCIMSCEWVIYEQNGSLSLNNVYASIKQNLYYFLCFTLLWPKFVLLRSMWNLAHT